MKKLKKRVTGVLYINGQRVKFTSWKDLPVDFRDEIIPLSHVYYLKNSVWKVLTQKVKLGLFSIITHNVKPEQDMMIIPRSNVHILTFHHMFGPDVQAMTADGAGVDLKDGSVGLFNLNDEENFAVGKKGISFRSIHINIDWSKVPALVKKYPELSLLLQNRVLHKEGPVNEKVYYVNSISSECLKHIMYGKYVERAGRSFLRTQGRLLMEIFLNQYHAMEIAENMPGKIEKRQIEECFDYLKNNLLFDINTSEEVLAKKFRIRLTTLQAGFIAMYGLSINRYVQMMRLNLSFKMLFANCPIPKVAREICFTSEAEFNVQFKRWFGITPGSVSNAN